MAIGGEHMQKRPLAITEREYLKGGAWRCEKSPTGGHWWDCNVRPSVCKICGKVKDFGAS